MSDPSPEQIRYQIRELTIKAKFYRLTATLFFFVGGGLFLMLYFQKVDGHVLESLRHPFLIIALIMPFLPAAVLAKLADKSRKQILKLTEKPAAEQKPPA
jgi:hypothetical protein